MDYSYFSAPPQQPYHHFLGMPPSAFPHSGVDPDTIRSVEPLDPTLFPVPYDAFTFHGLPTPQQGSPDAAVAHTPMPVGSVDSGIGDDGRASQTRSSSEEKESLTPAQSRRKAQNRAAQRAFRERKERHVRELETKLTALESSTHSLQSDNDRLKLALQRARTENEILRATSGHSPAASRPVSASYPSPGAHLPLDEDSDADDDDYNVQSLTNGSVMNAADKEQVASRRTSKGRQIPAAQAWDFIQSHPLVKQGLVDITDVCERVKGAAKCDGHGPVFEEDTLWQAVEESRRCGGDELI
ncbi:uncharacterized protein K460DRAFT_293853 [Cucurbitaria berberidis CBS 394.84]|uniref:BZIP domain-containing protein n=1 Tax=Cucurbitaria berberidis CBS 394.84 TaxID=1168544 RepID=A0A9P4G910_9PLEO|nr:uncharacterized protein K460DRAFT_293853 [Cucurbitaria berberidis CBS 394.84]KAF1841353.1 hypothetical protein K460DRAFT_293853 [Cucurbitaria berberidis CBS 394.84]